MFPVLQKINTYIFMYSHLSQIFDSNLALVSTKIINSFLLRARLNSHRNIKIYTVKLTDVDYNNFQNRLNSQLKNDSSVFKDLQHKQIVEIPW